MYTREIWRGKRLDNDEWVYGGLQRRKSRFAPQLKESYGIEDDYGTFTLIDFDTRGQCTGLHDINFKPIFEGDIVKLCDTNPILFIASIERSKFGWKCVFRYADDGKLVKNCFLDKCEVIGNIHDNPDLLGGAV